MFLAIRLAVATLLAVGYLVWAWRTGLNADERDQIVCAVRHPLSTLQASLRRPTE